MKSLWTGSVLFFLLLGLASLIAAGIGGARWGWAVLALGLLAAQLRHLRNLARLHRWAHQPMGAPVPYGSGIWGWVYASLARRARTAQGQRQELSVALERLLDAAHAMHDGVIILDRHHAIEWLNAAAQRQFGLKAPDDLGAPITNLVRQPELIAYLEGADYAEPLVIHPGWGGGQAYSLQVIPFGASQKLMVSRDVTQLERLERMRRDFVANVSHELKTPLTVVRGFVETLADNLPHLSADETRRYLGLTEEQTYRMQRLVDDLLTLSELENGTPLPFDDEVEAAALIGEVQREAEALSGGRHRIGVEAGPPLILLGSTRELRSAFANLASNAVRYTPDGGSVTLRWELAADGGARFTVQDTGIGIDAVHIPRLTERFYRVDRGRSRESGGTGLGLAIVKHILTRHQGSLEILSEPGRGSRFIARLPGRRVRPLTNSILSASS